MALPGKRIGARKQLDGHIIIKRGTNNFENDFYFSFSRLILDTESKSVPQNVKKSIILLKTQLIDRNGILSQVNKLSCLNFHA